MVAARSPARSQGLIRRSGPALHNTKYWWTKCRLPALASWNVRFTRTGTDFSELNDPVPCFDEQAFGTALSNRRSVGGYRIFQARSATVEWNLEHEINALGQPVGVPVPNWTPPARTSREPMVGRHCRVEPLEASRHATALFEAHQLDVDGRGWTYLPYGPFDSPVAYEEWVAQAAAKDDPLFWAIVDRASGSAVGVASYMRVDPTAGSIEIGHIHFSPLLQRKPAATEALFMMMQRAFRHGYRRLEWKCNALNEPSRRAAQRLGLSYEGVFRQATIAKGRNRDTAWYAAIDSEWPELQAAFANWLSPENFDACGVQKTSLSTLTAPVLKRLG